MAKDGSITIYTAKDGLSAQPRHFVYEDRAGDI